jgi:hypothetical protein
MSNKFERKTNIYFRFVNHNLEQLKKLSFKVDNNVSIHLNNLIEAVDEKDSEDFSFSFVMSNLIIARDLDQDVDTHHELNDLLTEFCYYSMIVDFNLYQDDQMYIQYVTRDGYILEATVLDAKTDETFYIEINPAMISVRTKEAAKREKEFETDAWDCDDTETLEAYDRLDGERYYFKSERFFNVIDWLIYTLEVA